MRDAAHDETEAQKKDVLKVLNELGVDDDGERPVVEVLNKIDLLEPEVRQRAACAQPGAARQRRLRVSALTGEGTDTLLALLDRITGETEAVFDIKLAPEDGAGLAWAYAHGRVAARKERASAIHLSVAIAPQDIDRFAARYGANMTAEQRVRRVS